MLRRMAVAVRSLKSGVSSRVPSLPLPSPPMSSSSGMEVSTPAVHVLVIAVVPDSEDDTPPEADADANDVGIVVVDAYPLVLLMVDASPLVPAVAAAASVKLSSLPPVHDVFELPRSSWAQTASATWTLSASSSGYFLSSPMEVEVERADLASASAARVCSSSSATPPLLKFDPGDGGEAPEQVQVLAM